MDGDGTIETADGNDDVSFIPPERSAAPIGGCFAGRKMDGKTLGRVFVRHFPACPMLIQGSRCCRFHSAGCRNDAEKLQRKGIEKHPKGTQRNPKVTFTN